MEGSAARVAPEELDPHQSAAMPALFVEALVEVPLARSRDPR